MKNDSTELHFFAEVKSLYQRKRALILLLMRISAINVILLFLVSAASMAHSITARGQSIEDTYVELEFDQAPIRDVLTVIEEQTEFSFSILSHSINGKHKVSLKAGTYSVKDALDLILEGTGLDYEQTENYIIVSPKKENRVTSPDIKYPENEAAQPKAEGPVTLVTGAVINASTQERLAGVNIIVKGTTKGTTTDVEGKFSIEAEDNDVLVFSFIGFRPFETAVGGRSVIDVAMEVDVTALKEVEINAGYWNVKEREQTGNIARVTADKIRNQPISNPLAVLQGQIAGVNIVQNTGVPGGSFDVQIRGQNSLRDGKGGFDNGNLPFYIVDGVPFNSTGIASPRTSGIIRGGSPLSAINPNDIESIEILKEADATAIYGSRGANGVILITTKKGKSGKTNFEAVFSSGVGQVSNKMDLLNTPQYLAMIKESLQNDGQWPVAPPLQQFAPDFFAWDTTRYTNWQNALIGGTANITNAQTSISGGNENTQFLFSGNFYRETTVFPGDFAFQRKSGLLNLNHAPVDSKFISAISISYSSQKSNLFPNDLTSRAMVLAPTAPVLFDEYGKLNWEKSTWTNPLSVLEKQYESRTSNLVTSANLSYEIIPKLRLKSNIGYTAMQVRETSTNPLTSIDPAYRASNTGSTVFANGNLETWIVEPQADYQLNLGQGNLTILVGASVQESIQARQTISGLGYTSDALLLNLSAASSVRSLESTYSQYRYNAVFGRVNYNWRGEYIINLTARRDGSSRFGPGKQFANYGAVGLAWIFTRNGFISNFTFLSFGKLRGSYGLTGSDQIGDYQFLDTYAPSNFTYAGTSSLIVTRLPNKNFSWETNRKFEAGLELGFLEDYIFLTASWYRNLSSNQLVNFPLPAITGANGVQANFDAAVVNRGWEITLNTNKIKSNNFSWALSLNLTIPENELIEYQNIEGSPYFNKYVVGKSLYVQPSLKYMGLDSGTGLYSFLDVNGDGDIRWPDDIASFPEVTQKFFGGLYNSVGYKGITLDFLFDFKKQTGFGYPTAEYEPGGSFNFNQPAFVLDRWQESGDIAEFQRFSTFAPDASGAFSDARRADMRIIDTSFIRLRNISLSYNFPNKLVSRIRAQNVRIYAQAQNLFTITNYFGLDPETQSISILPPLRIISMGTQISF